MYIKAFLFAGVACCGTSHWAFSSIITDTKTEQDETTGAVTVTYKLTGEDAVITADVQTNSVQNKAWASIGPVNYTGMTGDVWKKVVADGSVRTISWPALADGETKPPKFDKHVRVVLTAWSTKAPPDFFVIDLTKEEVPAFYTHEVLLPYGGSVQNQAYKDRYLLMKRIHAAGITWMMGNDPVAKKQVSTSYQRATDYAHPVVLTHDYYIGVYELTKAQRNRIENEAVPDASPRVAENFLGFCTLRGQTDGVKYPVFTDGKFDYLESAKVDSGSVIANLRAKADNEFLFDLPTWAQWEFAARAGSRSVLPDGVAYTQANTEKYARVSSNKGTADCEGLKGNIATVGSYLANGFGLYDVLGNVSEATLDRLANDYVASPTKTYAYPWLYPADEVTVDPIGGTDTAVNSRAYFAGCYDQDWNNAYIGRWQNAISWTDMKWSYGYLGARIALTLR